MNKIAFFTETIFEGKVPRTDLNLRVPQSWMASLDITFSTQYLPLYKCFKKIL